MQHGHNYFRSGTSLFLVNINRNPAAVIFHRYRSVAMYNDFDLLAIPGQGFIDRVIDGFKNHVMQTGAIIGITNVHPWSLAHSIEAF